MKRVHLLVFLAAFSGHAFAGEINLTPKMVRDVSSRIQQAGYNCPEVKLAWAKGQDAYGSVAKVYCGPAGTSGAWKKSAFRLTFRPNGGVIIRPWRD